MANLAESREGQEKQGGDPAKLGATISQNKPRWSKISRELLEDGSLYGKTV